MRTHRTQPTLGESTPMSDIIRKRLFRSLKRNFLIALGLSCVAMIASLAPALAQFNGPANSPILGTPGYVPSATGFGVDSWIGTIQSWIGALETMADRIFIALCMIEGVWLTAKFLLQGRENLGELIGEWMKKMLTWGLFYFVLVRHGYQVVMVIISSLVGAGMQAGAGNTGFNTQTPDQLFGEGFSLALPMMIYSVIFAALPNYFSALFWSIGFTNWQVPIIAIQMFGATATIGAFTFMAGTLLLTTFEAYLVTVVGTIMSAFSALRITHSYGAQKMLSYAFSVGIKLMMLNLCIGVVQTLLVPQIQNYAGIPLLGSVLAGFAALAASLIAYNASTFAAGIVTGMANGNFSGTMAAVQGSISGARAIAAGMQQMSQSTHDMSQANKLEADDKKAEQAKGATTGSDPSLHHYEPPANSLSHQGDVTSSASNTSGSANGASHAGGASTQSQSAQMNQQSQSVGGIPIMSDSGKAAQPSAPAAAGNTQGTGAANGSAVAPGGPPVVPASGKQNDLDSAHLKSFEQHLEQRYGAGSDKLTKDQKDDLDKLLKHDKQGMQQDFATGFNGVRDGMMGMIGKGQDQSVGAVQIRSSV